MRRAVSRLSRQDSDVLIRCREEVKRGQDSLLEHQPQCRCMHGAPQDGCGRQPCCSEVGKVAAQGMADILGEAETWDWDRSDAWPAVVRLSDRVKVDVLKPVAPEGGGVTRNDDGSGQPLARSRGRASHHYAARSGLAGRSSYSRSTHAGSARIRRRITRTSGKGGSLFRQIRPTAPLTEPFPTCPRSSATRILRHAACWWPTT